jgi:toxin ParE1/3/4
VRFEILLTADTNGDLEQLSREYRQTFFKAYRLIYRVIGRRVYAYLIADGRRDMQALLEQRLLGA